MDYYEIHRKPSHMLKKKGSFNPISPKFTSLILDNGF